MTIVLSDGHVTGHRKMSVLGTANDHGDNP